LQERPTLFGGLLILSLVCGFLSGYDYRLFSSPSVHQNLSAISVSSNKMSPLGLLGELSKERRRVMELIKNDYGEEHYSSVFGPSLRFNDVISMDDITRERIINRLMLKIAAAHSSHHTDSEPFFTWITSGDETAAAYGNFQHQSYTSILLETVSTSFAALGIRFEARNHAMGRHISRSPELAFCMESIFGEELDIVSWDFGLGDASRVGNSLWGNRVASHRSHPILFVMDSRERDRWRAKIPRETHREPAIYMDTNGVNKLARQFPDSSRLPPAQATYLPPALRYYTCEGHSEGTEGCDDPPHYVCQTDPTCVQQKFIAQAECPEITEYQHLWNDGWKEHLFRGRLMGMWLLDLLKEALLELDAAMTNPKGTNTIKSNWASILHQLTSKDESYRTTFMKSPPFKVDDALSEEITKEISWNILYRQPTICHTALFPSQLRNKPHFQDLYDHYTLGEKNHYASKKIGQLPLVLDPSERPQCSIPTKVDFRDYFSLERTSGFMTCTMDANRNAQLKQFRLQKGVEGFVMICLRKCFGIECPPNRMTFTENILEQGKLVIEINGDAATGVVQWDDDCYFVKHLDSLKWDTLGGGNGRINIKFRVNTNDEMQISSIIVF